jgi:hypothetical protein
MNPYAYLIAAVVAAAMLAGSYLQGRSDGTDITTSAYATRDLQGAQVSFAKYQEISEKYRTQETNWQARFVSQARTYQGKVVDNAKALDIALTSGRLYDRFAAPSQACGDSAAKVAADPVAVSPAGTQLSAELDRFLKSEASRADKVVLDLNLCIGVLEEERR